MNFRLIVAILGTLACVTLANPLVAREAAVEANSAALHPAGPEPSNTRSVESPAGHADHEHGAAGHSEAAHADGGHGGGKAPELPNLISVFLDLKTGGSHIRDTHMGHVLHTWEKHIMLIIVVAILLWVLMRVSRKRTMRPGRAQTLLELAHEGFHSFLGGILGEKNLKYVPFLGTVFLFIWFNNLAGLVPGFAAATSVYPTTLALALIVFTYVQIQGIRAGGVKHYLLHFIGSPKDFAGVVIGICLLPLEIIGFLAKPISLSLRLFGNIMGEDILLGVFLILGLTLMGAFWPDPLIGVPLHLPFMFMGILTCTVQALVFTLLSTIYLMLLLPHEHHDEAHHHNEHREGLPNDEGNHIGGGEISPV